MELSDVVDTFTPDNRTLNLLKMKRNRTISLLSLSLIVLLFQGLVMNADAAKKPKGLIIPEGDNAVLVSEGGYTTITFPASLSAEELDLYNTDLVGYILRINGKMSTDGNEYKGTSVYYYVHNSKEWLHKGQYENPGQLTVSKIKSIRISNTILRLREFNTQMPLLDGDKEKKNDSGYQEELQFGENRYTFFDVTLRD